MGSAAAAGRFHRHPSVLNAVRPPAVAGRFYPSDPDELRATVERFLNVEWAGPNPKAIIAPHAGYIFSGPTAGRAYASLHGVRDRIRKVILAGPSHWLRVDGVACSSATTFETPLGPVAVDRLPAPATSVNDRAHAEEHSLEVQLPFLQLALDDFTVVPILVEDPSKFADILDACWNGDTTLIVVSTDLSHYHHERVARELDAATASAIVEGRHEAIAPTDACGSAAVKGLVMACRRHQLTTALVDLCTSADTAGAGHADRVVGYGAFVAYSPAATAMPSHAQRSASAHSRSSS